MHGGRGAKTSPRPACIKHSVCRIMVWNRFHTLWRPSVSNDMRPRVGLAVIRHPFEEGADAAERIAGEAAKALEFAEVVASPVICESDSTARAAGRAFREADVDAIVAVLATWSSDAVATRILDYAPVPMVIWALPAVNTGSICGAHQLCCVLTELGLPYRFVHGELTERRCISEAGAYLMAAMARKRLRTVNLGQVGSRVEGMTEVSFDEFSMRKVFGPAVEHLSIDEFLKMRDSQDPAAAADVWARVKRRAGKVSVPDTDGLRSAHTYLALKEWARESDLAGLALECYPNLMGEACLAYSLLADEGIVAACEGDMNSALATLVLYWLSGEPVHNTDLLAHRESDNTILLSHCGSGSFEIADERGSIHLAPVRLAHKGLCVLFPARPGPVTLLNLVGREGTYRMTAFAGEAVKTGMDFAGNPLRVVCPVDVTYLTYRVAEIGAGHHWMVCYGDVMAELEHLAELTGVPFAAIG